MRKTRSNDAPVNPLGSRQVVALNWLAANGPWTTPWWGGRPHTGWPKEMTASTFEKLIKKRFVEVRPTGQRFDRTATISEYGKKAIGLLP